MLPLPNVEALHTLHSTDPKIQRKIKLEKCPLNECFCTQTKPTFWEIFDIDSHSANGFNEQSHDNGLSCNDKRSRSVAVSNAFLATIDMSFPSSCNSCKDGNGATKSEDKAL